MLEQWILAFALMLVIEGALYALFPDLIRRAIAAALAAPVNTLRLGGAIAVAVGVFIVWLVKGI